MIIRKYDESQDYEKIKALFKTEKDWECYTKDNNLLKYKESLNRSITYVAYEDEKIIGYCRSLEDYNFYIYICDLLVEKGFRGKDIGKKLMESLLQDYPSYDIFVMSDVDGYYEKLNYGVEGTIFRVSK